MYDICTEAANAVSSRAAAELNPEEDFNEALAATNFTEEEFQNFEANADKLELEDVGKIVNEKVIATIKSEQEAYDTEQALDNQIKDLVAETAETPEDLEKGVESFYTIALDNNNPRHHVSLFSKLCEVGIEAMITLHPDEVECDVCPKTLNDVTFLFGLESYRRGLDAVEALTRLVNMDESMLDENTLHQAAVEGLQNGNVAKTAFGVTATAYTLMETLNTMNIHNVTATEVESFINKRGTMRSYVDSAIESFVGSVDEFFAESNAEIRKLKDVESLRQHRSFYSALESRISEIRIASEALTECKAKFAAHINDVYKKIDDKIAYLSNNTQGRTASEQVAFEQDLAAINRLYMLYGKRESVSHMKITADERGGNNEVRIDFMDAMESPLNQSSLQLHGSSLEYVSELISGSKFKQNGRRVVYATTAGTRSEL